MQTTTSENTQATRELGATRATPLNVVLIGCGAVSQLYYAPALQQLERTGELRVTGLLDPNPAAVERLGATFPAARSLTEIAQAQQFSTALAIIASPPRWHAEHAIQALRAGLGVLCEKPMATRTVDCKRMIAAAEEAKRVLAVGLFRRFFPATQMIAAAVGEGMLGQITSVTCFEGGPFAWPVGSPDYFRKETSGGGVLLDIGVHVLDLLLWWFGDPSEIHYTDDAMGEIEVNCRVELRYPAGFTADVRLSREWFQPNEYLITGTKGWLRWEANEAEKLQMGMKGIASFLNGSLYERVEPLRSSRGSANFHQSFIAQLRNVMDAVTRSAPVRVPGRDGMRSIELIESCYEGRRLMPLPWLTDEEFGEGERLGRQAVV